MTETAFMPVMCLLFYTLTNLNNYIMNTYQRVEIYTLNAETKETGWEIEFILVKGQSRSEARERLKNYPLFDCVITWEGYESIESNEDFIKP